MTAQQKTFSAAILLLLLLQSTDPNLSLLQKNATSRVLEPKYIQTPTTPTIALGHSHIFNGWNEYTLPTTYLKR